MDEIVHYLYADLNLQTDESYQRYLYRIGKYKEEGKINLSWPDIAEQINSIFDYNYSDSKYRKQYRKLCNIFDLNDDNILDIVKSNETLESYIDFESKRNRIKEQRSLLKKDIKNKAHIDEMLDIIRSEIKAIKTEDIKEDIKDVYNTNDKVMIAMLSDVHYGNAFKTAYSEYNTQIAKNRIIAYANKLISISLENHIDSCYLFLLGDMISGNIHTTLRIENSQNLVNQVIGVSEVISLFLNRLSSRFKNIFVLNVNGNHSRIHPDANEVLNGERLDALIPWYCEARLRNNKEITFLKSNNGTIADITICGKRYIGVHGDMDSDLKKTVMNIEQNTRSHIDYILAAHLHIADMRLQNTGFIRNGSVITSGDEYTTKKRLYGPATQVCLIASNNGVECIYPVKLS